MYNIGDTVLLSTKNIKLVLPGTWLSDTVKEAHGSRKLLPKWIGPFEITTVINPLAYRVALPANLRIHHVFHVSVLKKYNEDARYQPPPPPTVVDGEEYYDVDYIVDHRIKGRKHKTREFHVHWLGYNQEQDTWEPEESLQYTEALQAYKTYRKIS